MKFRLYRSDPSEPFVEGPREHVIEMLTVLHGGELTSKHVGEDPHTGWDTHLILRNGEPLGYSDEPLDDTVGYRGYSWRSPEGLEDQLVADRTYLAKHYRHDEEVHRATFVPPRGWGRTTPHRILCDADGHPVDVPSLHKPVKRYPSEPTERERLIEQMMRDKK